ncbi:T9SS type A sorting domain-containing protein [Lacinutrix sp. MEBiC02595]
MKKTLFFLTLMGILSIPKSFSQLSAGDIAFIGMNEDVYLGTQDNSFSWISLTDIAPGEVIYFTDQGVNINSNTWFDNDEGHYSWTAPTGGTACGTVVYVYEDGSSNNLIASSGVCSLVAGSGWDLSNGDQVLAYQSASAKPASILSATFIAGIHKEGDGFAGEINSWTDPVYAQSDAQYSHLPPGLTNGVNCISVFDAGIEYDNVKYTATLTGTSITLLELINDASNWTIDTTNYIAQDITVSAYAPAVTCVTPCTQPTVPVVIYQPETICEGNMALISISGELNYATEWKVYTGSCGGTLVGSTSSDNLIVSPPSGTTTYYVRGEGGCVTPGLCGTVNITTTPREDASFSYDASAYCVDTVDPTPTITGVPGGYFFSTAGLSINSATGVIDVSASTPNTYTVNYYTLGICDGAGTASVTINGLEDASFSYAAATYSQTDGDPTATITGLAGGSFSSTAGLSIDAVTGTIDVSESTPNIYMITYTTAGNCPKSSSVSIEITAALGIVDNTLIGDAFYFVNPVFNILTVESSIEIAYVKIYSLQGALVASAKDSKVDVSFLSSGVYIALINTSNGLVASKKMIKL